MNRPYRFQRAAYHWGLRPRPGSPFFSPSLAMLYGWRDAARKAGFSNVPGKKPLRDQ